MAMLLCLIVAGFAIYSQQSAQNTSVNGANVLQASNDDLYSQIAATVSTSSRVSLNNLPPSVGKLPTTVGQCDKTIVTRIGTRLQNADGSDALGSGSAVWYADGGYQVSYDTITGVTDSKIGDAVMHCLVSIPTDCPPGDNRGSVYQAINLRTAEEWTAQDSEHSCGGA